MDDDSVIYAVVKFGDQARTFYGNDPYIAKKKIKYTIANEIFEYFNFDIDRDSETI